MKIVFMLLTLVLVLTVVSAKKPRGNRGGHRHQISPAQKKCKGCVKKCLYVDQNSFADCISAEEDNCFNLCTEAKMIPCLECIDDCKNTANDDGSERTMRFCIGRQSPCHQTCYHS
ncbi:uncharacterized protein LOC135495962 [Lineus longissimus]|uniref:uncharacterized protein LOC135495962 n=1 Tax=Lineus longissimus TaxID=88925 RepID=UPI002B4D4F85